MNMNRIKECRSAVPLTSGKRVKQGGFTLIELMIVVVIIGILAALAIPRFMSATTKQKQNEAKVILKQLYVNQRAYRQENSTYWGNGISADSLPANQRNFATLTVEIMSSARYTYSIVATTTTFTITANATGLDDDAAPDTWTIDNNGILAVTSDDAIL